MTIEDLGEVVHTLCVVLPALFWLYVVFFQKTPNSTTRLDNRIAFIEDHGGAAPLRKDNRTGQTWVLGAGEDGRDRWLALPDKPAD
jgi:hypothetical protein